MPAPHAPCPAAQQPLTRHQLALGSDRVFGEGMLKATASEIDRLQPLLDDAVERCERLSALMHSQVHRPSYIRLWVGEGWGTVQGRRESW